MKKNGEYVGVDEKYIPEDERYVSDSNNKTEKTVMKIGLGMAIVWVVMGILIFGTVIFIMFKGFGIFNNIFNMANNQISNTANTINDKQSQIDNQISNIDNRIANAENEMNNQIEQQQLQSKINQHNRTLQNLYTGTKNGFQIKNALNKVISINQTSDKKIIVVYNETNTQDSSEIGTLSKEFDDFTDYLVTYDYDSEGYISTMNISNI